MKNWFVYSFTLFVSLVYGRIHLVHLRMTGKLDDLSVNFQDVFFFIFCYNLAKNEEKHIMKIYGWVVRNFPVVRKWSRWIRPKSLLQKIHHAEKVWKILHFLLHTNLLTWKKGHKSNFLVKISVYEIVIVVCSISLWTR